MNVIALSYNDIDLLMEEGLTKLSLSEDVIEQLELASQSQVSIFCWIYMLVKTNIMIILIFFRYYNCYSQSLVIFL